jgi:ketosteroid isomerase-like protein
MATNKDTAWSYFQCLNDKRIDDAIALLDDDGSFWSLRTQKRTPTREQTQYLRASTAHIPIQFALHNAVEDGDQVALEISSHAELDDGFVYDNLYCFVIQMRDGKIFEVREYLDPRPAQEIVDYLS